MSVSVAVPAKTQFVAPLWVQMAAATIGVALETFDLVIYGFLAVTLSSVFFPARNPTISLLLVFGVYPAGPAVQQAAAIIAQLLA